MADALAARREARRRRILENSRNRLQLISGKVEDDSYGECSVKTVVYPRHVENQAPYMSLEANKQPVNNGFLSTDSYSTDLSVRQDPSGDTEIINNLAALISESSESDQTQNSWKFLFASKYDIVLLSLLIQLMYCLSILTYEDVYFFLLPTIYIMTKLTWFPCENKGNNVGIANMLLLLNGIPVSKVNKILSVLQGMVDVSQDLCVFLFTTICVQSLYITLKESLIT